MLMVRRARHEDLDDLTALLCLLFSLEADFDWDEKKQHQGLNLMLNNSRGCVLVAENENRIVGMCTGQVVISTAEGGPAVLVEDVVVAEEAQGQGVGRALLEAMAAWAREQGATRMQLLADANNTPALQFYQQVGWRRTELICLRQAV
ncbi:GNAT family N-acetyltransferase [Desulfobulbus alkaliphilus]|nr:GNAT family N-acetyltransferase [Desulfobulbus alkaliphilus]